MSYRYDRDGNSSLCHLPGAPTRSRYDRRPWFRGITLACWTAASVLCGQASETRSAQVVPGSGTHIDFVGDNLEDPQWEFVHQHPKSSYENDHRRRWPGGYSLNRRWQEGGERGQPDLLEVVPTPEGGLHGSQYALLMQTLHSGIPGRISHSVEQDDLVVDSVNHIGTIPVTEAPSIVVRVYLPPSEKWERRTGPHFGFRAQLATPVRKSEPQSAGRFRSTISTVTTMEPYWPGIWIHFRTREDAKTEQDGAYFTVRGNRLGHDFKVREITADEFGWWTMGMSFTPDGAVHYYLRPGVEDLTPSDFLTTQVPYGYRAQRFENMFFNICNYDDGKTWSTPIVIDDPKIFVERADRIESIVRRKRAAATAQQAAPARR